MPSRFALYLRTIIFGVTDSLVSTVGLLAGISVAGANTRAVALTGAVYAIVEAFSMAVGNYLSEKSGEEYEAGKEVSLRAPLAAALVMFFVFVLAAAVPLAPYLLLGNAQALAASVIISILALFVVGAIGARLSKVPVLWRGVRMAFLGGAAILIGIIVGYFFPAAN